LANGDGGRSNKEVLLWAAVSASLAAGIGNTGYQIANPIGERVATAETKIVILQAESNQRAALFSDVGEIKADMRWLRAAVSEMKDDLKARP